MKNTPFHIPVLLNESIDGLDIQNGDTVVDGTFGGGGHSKNILEKFDSKIELICVDLDEKANERYRECFKNNKNSIFIESNFKDTAKILEISKKKNVDRVLLDLGTSTYQLLEDDRGFSFKSATPLSMSFSQKGAHTDISAYDIVNFWEENNIADVIYAYGEDVNSRKIARKIVKEREKKPIEDSVQLADIINSAFVYRGRFNHATKTFQAFRIVVNDELNVLKQALDNWWKVLNTNGRMAIISFHSLEDRIVKQWMKSQNHKEIITKKPLSASHDELLANPRSRSAKLRIIKKIND